jgi:peptide/nickel transport system substrate-binding protein
MLQEQLRQAGLTIDVVAVDQGSQIDPWSKADYDAIYFFVKASATDPARNLEIWLSSGSFHFWNPEQAKPATEWEAAADDLMRKQSATSDRAERRRLFAGVQRLYAEHLPLLYFAVPKVTIAMSSRVRGATPSVVQPPVLWNAEALWVGTGGKVPAK